MAFNAKVALVTGGASGVGRVAALRLANQGAKVAIVDGDERALLEAAAESVNITPFSCDVSDIAAVQHLVTEVEASLGSIDSLIHSAAIMPAQSLAEMSAEAINRCMSINFGGTVNTSKVLLPLMAARGRGDIVVVGSMFGDVLTHNMGAYSAAESATNTYVEVLAREHRHSPLRFLLVCPPLVDVPLIGQTHGKGHQGLHWAASGAGALSPESVMDTVERALDKGCWVVRPGEAGIMMLWRRLFPSLLWRVMERMSCPSLLVRKRKCVG